MFLFWMTASSSGVWRGIWILLPLIPQTLLGTAVFAAGDIARTACGFAPREFTDLDESGLRAGADGLDP